MQILKNKKKYRVKFFSRKDQGNVMHLIPAICCCVVVALMIVVFSSWMANIDKKNNIDLVARKYILRMETKGYLDNADQSSLQTELNGEGCSGVDLAGSTIAKVDYGDEIVLNITGQMKIYNYRVLDIFAISTGTGDIPFTLNRTSTAKH